MLLNKESEATLTNQCLLIRNLTCRQLADSIISWKSKDLLRFDILLYFFCYKLLYSLYKLHLRLFFIIYQIFSSKAMTSNHCLTHCGKIKFLINERLIYHVIICNKIYINILLAKLFNINNCTSKSFFILWIFLSH